MKHETERNLDDDFGCCETRFVIRRLEAVDDQIHFRVRENERLLIFVVFELKERKSFSPHSELSLFLVDRRLFSVKMTRLSAFTTITTRDQKMERSRDGETKK